MSSNSSAESDSAWQDLRDNLQHHCDILAMGECPTSVRRLAATHLLSIISTFLHQWNHSSWVEKRRRKRKRGGKDFPVESLRHALSVLLAHEGQGDCHVLTFLLEQLQLLATATTTSTTGESLQLLLDFLPAAMPMMMSEGTRTTTTSKNSILEAATKQVLESLCKVLSEKPSALLPIIGCLSVMPLSRKGRIETFHVALKSLRVVSETGLPSLVAALLRYPDTAAEDDKEGKKNDKSRHKVNSPRIALEAVRAEMRLLESTYLCVPGHYDEGNNRCRRSEGRKAGANAGEGRSSDPVTAVVDVVLNALFDDSNRNCIAHAYTAILENVISSPGESVLEDSVDHNRHDNQTCKGGKGNNELLALDMAVLLALHEYPEFSDPWERPLDSLLQQNQFPFQILLKLLYHICEPKKFGRPISIVYSRLVHNLVSFGIFLLLAPVRIVTGKNNSPEGLDYDCHAARQRLQEAMKQSQDFIVNLHHQVDLDVQSEVLHCLLHLSEKTATSKWASTFSSSSRSKTYPRARLWSKSGLELLNYCGVGSQGEGEESYEWFQIMVDDAVNATLQILAKTDKQIFWNFKHVLIGRLTTNEPFRSTQWERRCIQHLCSILSVLLEPTSYAIRRESHSGSESAGIQASDLLVILQKLLFTAPFASYSSIGTSSGGGADPGRVVRGLVLATELVKSPFMGQGDCDCVKQWVLRKLLPTTGRMVDPEVGTLGLQFLEATMIDRCMTNNGVSGTGMSLSTTPLRSKKQAFQRIKTMLANTGLVQYLAHYQRNLQDQQQIQHKKEKQGAVLAYTSPPPAVFVPESAKKGTKRDMVFCLAFFLRETDLHSPSRWSHTLEWVFHLVETYLRVGRDISISSPTKRDTHLASAKPAASASNRWRPNGWLQAAIEYPSICLPQLEEPLKEKEERAVKWANDLFSCDGTREEDGEMQSGMMDFLERLKSIHQLHEISESILKLSLSSLLAMSLSFAILQNAFEDYRSFPESQERTAGQREVLRLLQFQLAKVYDMQTKFKSVETLLRAAVMCARKRNRAAKAAFQSERDGKASGNDFSQNLNDELHFAQWLTGRLDHASFQLEDLHRKLFASNDFLVVQLLSACLVDGEQDAWIHKSIDELIAFPESSLNSTQVALLHLMHLRRGLVDHLLLVFPSGGRSQLSCPEVCLAACLENGLYLCSTLPRLRKACHLVRKDAEDDVDGMMELVAAVLSVASKCLELVLMELINAMDLSHSATRHTSTNYSTDRFASLIAICARCCELRYNEKTNTACTTRPIEYVFEHLLIELQEIDNRMIASVIFEILSALVAADGGKLSQSLLTASWKALHTVYPSAANCQKQCRLPFALAAALHQAYENVGTRKQKKLEKCLKSTILRRYPTFSTSIRQSLLRHLGLFILFPGSADLGIDHFQGIYEQCSLLLDSFDGISGEECFDRLEKDKSRSRSTGRATDIGTACEDIKSGRKQSFICNIPELNTPSVPIVFETLLQSTVAGMAAMSIVKVATDRPKGTAETKGPYRGYESLLRLFSSLLRLYATKIHLFPRRTRSSVFSAARHMLAMTVGQIQNCVGWRNRLPLFSAAGHSTGAYDPGAIRYLQGFLDVCWIHALVSALSFCFFFSVQEREEGWKATSCKMTLNAPEIIDSSQGDGDSDHVDDEENEGVDASSEKKILNKRSLRRVFSLRQSCERFAQVVRSIALSHNLAAPDVVDDEVALSKNWLPQTRKSLGKEDEGFHQLNTKREALLRGRSEIDDYVGANEELNDHEGAHGSDGVSFGQDRADDRECLGSFCATGHWGDDESSSKSSLILAIDAPLFE